MTAVLLVLSAFAGPSQLAETVALDLWRDGVHGEREALREQYAAECEVGSETACRSRRWYSSAGPDLARAAAQLKELCKGGDPVACLVNGWHLSQVRPGVVSSEAENLPVAGRLFELACEGGLQRACAEHGNLLLRGLLGDPQPARALSLVGPACEEGVAPACAWAAEASVALGEPQAAQRWLVRGGGHGAVLLTVGQLAEADGRRGDAERAWLAACDAGAPRGCLLAADGAPSLIERACDAGDGDACGVLAQMVELPRSQELADRACLYDSASGCRVLSEVLLDKAARKLDVPGDVNQAERVLAKACRLGDGPACFRIGRADNHGGLPSVERACRLGDEAACNSLLAVFAQEDPPRLKEVLDWAEPRCEAGDPTQCLYAAAAWWRLGPLHFESAVSLWDAACELGDDLGCTLTGRAAEFGLNRPHDPAAALDIYREGCSELEGGYPCTELGHTYVRESIDELDAAEQWYQAGCDRGDAVGCMALLDIRRAEGVRDVDLLDLLEGACFHDNGYPEQCVAYEAAVMISGQPRAFTRGNNALLRACDMGNLASCPAHRRTDRWPWPLPSGPFLDAERYQCHLRNDRQCLIDATKAILGGAPEGWLLEQYAHLVMPACLVEPSLCKYEAAAETLSARSVDLYERACFEGGDTESCMRAALFYDQGLGEPPTKRRVLDLASRACTTADIDRERCYGLAPLMERWPGEPESTTRALVALCQTVAPSACLEAGDRVLAGIGVEGLGEPDLGYSLYLRGCARDDYEACKRLKRAGREAKSGQDPEKIQLKPSEEEEPSVFTDPNGVPSGGGPDF